MHCPVIITVCISIKGVLPPLEWSAFFSPFIKNPISHCKLWSLVFLNQFLNPLSFLSHTISRRAPRRDIPQVNAYQARQDPTPSSQRVPSVSRSHATYFERALKTHATNSKFLKKANIYAKFFFRLLLCQPFFPSPFASRFVVVDQSPVSFVELPFFHTGRMTT